MTTLREAREQGNIGQFISEHAADAGDVEAFSATLASMAGTSKAAPATSDEAPNDG
jgi:hypothetical protein